MGDQFLIPYVRSVWEMLRYRLRDGRRMCLFGAGAHTQWLLAVTADLPRPPVECILDDNPRDQTLCGIPVRRPEEVRPEAVDLILISSDRWEEKLACRARTLWGDRVEVLRLYDGLPRGPYDKGDDRAAALRSLGALSPLRPAEDRLVVIVSDGPRSREAKIGYALKHAGWRTTLLHRRDPVFDAARYFDHVRRFGNEWEALRIACDYSPAVYHIMVNSDFRTAELFLRHRPGVVVVDSYDLIAGMYREGFLSAHPDFAEEMGHERYCLEHADGICCRSREADVLEQALGYRLPRRLFFPDGCWNNMDSVMPAPGGELHIAYVGAVDAPVRKGPAFASCGCNMELARGLTQQRLHLHVFAASAHSADGDDGVFEAYRELERVSPYFHFHAGVRADALIRELTRFHAAVLVYPELAVPTGTPWGLTADKLRCCASNKLYDYVDAGLPIIHNAGSDSCLAAIINRHAVGIDVSGWPFAEWGSRLRELDLADLRGRTARARRDYDVRRHAGRLVDFYQFVRREAEGQSEKTCAQAERQRDADCGRKHRQAFV